MKKEIYLDNSATTKVYPEVIEETKKYFNEEYGNPSSLHYLGEKAQKKMNESRKKLAVEIGAKMEEIIFTSGGTESNNLALLGIARANKNNNRKKIIISSIEHSSVYEPAMKLKEEGFEIVEIRVEKDGLLKFSEFEKKIDKNTLLVSIIHANNEIGVLQDLRKIASMCKKEKIIFHTDAVQSFGKEKINAKEWGIDLLSASGHKIGAQKGIGFLYLREGINISPIIFGGGQERGLRGGTENVPAIAGFSRALEIIKKIDKNKIKKIRNYFMEEIEKIGGKITGNIDKRIYNNISVVLPVNAENLIIGLSQRGIYCSTKSACLSKMKEESKVLRAIGLSKNEINGSLRFVINEKISKKDIDEVVKTIREYI